PINMLKYNTLLGIGRCENVKLLGKCGTKVL
ncbi:MAG: hypothetical protein ACI8R4_001376, partial [Paracoccaceae bacterium]